MRWWAIGQGQRRNGRSVRISNTPLYKRRAGVATYYANFRDRTPGNIDRIENCLRSFTALWSNRDRRWGRPSLSQCEVATPRAFVRAERRTTLPVFSATLLPGRRRGRRRLGLLHVFHVAEQGAPVVETIAVSHVIAAARNPVVVLVYVAVLLPLLQEQLITLLREVASYCGVVVVTQTKVDQIVHGTPDTATPVVLVGKSGIVARDGGNDPLAPELIGVEQMLLNHGLRLGGSSGTRQQRIEVGRRKPVAELPGVQVLVQKNAVRLAP